MEYRIKTDNCVYSMSAKNKPALTVPMGSTVIFHTFDCFQNQIKNDKQEIENISWDNINPATGPLFIEEAKEGDILKVEIVNISIADQGVMAAIPQAGLLGDKVKKSEIKILPIIENKAIFNDNIQIPVNPMIGVIGVAPKSGEIPCGAPDSHGGNMDNAKIVAGTTLYFPVNIEGALLSMGDLHACMGDGEIMVTGVEISGSVKVRVDVIKERSIDNPAMEDKEFIYTIASDEDLLTAVKTATQEMHKIVMNKLEMSYNEAGMLLSAVGDIEICQVVDPKLTVRYKMPKSIVSEVV
ncbi:MAG: acetamidase [Firmicutes bacterium]|nr:acetamidase [Bacillota bacterium]